MGLQLGINESSNIILQAIKATGENFNRDFHHVYSTPGHQGFYTEIDDFTLEMKLHTISKDYNKDDHVFNLNIPYEYFNDDQLPGDTQLGIKLTDHTEVKAEIRCMGLIAKTYEAWIKDHEVFTINDLRKIINDALDRLRKIKKLDLMVRGDKGELAEKYIQIYLTENHIPATEGSALDRFFPVELHIYDYYTDVGNHIVDGSIGEANLRGKDRKEICLLRVAYTIYSECMGWLHNKWPKVYNNYLNGKF